MEPETGVDPRSLLEHRDFVRAVVRGLLPDEHAVDDVVQETCLRALERPPRHAALKAWLARVGRNLALTSLRRQRRRGRREREAARPERQPPAVDAAARLERHRLVVEAVLALEEPFRSAILLRFYEDLPPREIARQLGVPVDTVRSRLRRGLERLRAWLDARHGGDRAAWSLALLPLLGAREAAAAATGAAATGGGTKVLLVEGAVMSAKGKLVGAAIVLFAAAAGTVAWQASSARDRPATARTETRHPARIEEEAPAEKGGKVEVVAPESLPDRGIGPPGQPPREPTLHKGSASTGPIEVATGPARPKPYRLAEPTGETDTGALRVIVTDGNGNPIPDAQVIAGIAKGSGVTTTNYKADGAGRLELRSLEPGRWSVSAVALSQRRIALVEVQAGRFTEVAIKLAGGATVEGVVRHVERGPLAKVAVRLEREEDGFHDYYWSTTDEEGRYRLDGVPPGTHPVKVEGPFIGYDTRPRATIVVPGPGAVVHDIVLGRVNLRGAVRDADTGAPLSGVKIQFQGPSWWGEVTTDIDGAYGVPDLMPENYRVCITRDGYGMEFTETGPVPPDGVRTADFALRRAAVLVMEVLDGSGRPVPGRHRLALRPVGGSSGVGTGIDVDASGIGRYPRIVPGTYDVGVVAEGYAAQTQRVEVVLGENRLSFRLERAEAAGEAAEGGRVSLTGTIRDAVTGRPIPGARVEAQVGGRSETTSDPDGVYRLRDVRPGKCTIVVGRDGYGIRFVRDVEIGEDARTLDFDLVPAATLHVHVTDKAGRPVVGRVFLGFGGKDEGLTRVGTSVETDAEGHGVYRQVVPGRYELRILKADVGEAKVEVEILPGENVVRVRLE